ncbi:MAG: SusC/RagA family TonB-linked outer membrane protein [Bacteroidota bacterium]|nr:SusC/RagA family TonB-linked outer membrane protein [Bacteroidota bacterium]
MSVNKHVGSKGFIKKAGIIALVVIVLSQLSATLQAQNQKVSVFVREATVQEVFHQLEKTTSYTFLYKNELLNGKAKVNLNVKGEPLSQVLDELLNPRGLTYELDDKVIIIKTFRKVEPKNQSTSKRQLSGQVTDNLKEPLPGATVAVKGENQRTITDIDGNFQLPVADGRQTILVVSYIGMETKEVTAGTQKRLVIQLEPSSVLLKDYVVVGAYGTTQKRSDLVGSAYQVDSKKLEALPAGRIDNLLDGMVPGLQITYNTDLASATRPRYNTRVRGQSSMTASSEPMWIIDGTPVYTGEKTNQVPGLNSTISPLSYINADDIESITVLKDASATSIYGANGANGVILVTTKKGSSGKTAIAVSTRYGISTINESTRFKVLNAQQYLMLAKEAWVNAGKDLASFPFQDNAMNSYSATNTNWTDVYYGLGNTSETNLMIRGGNEKAKYYVSGGYYRNKLTVKGNVQQRFSVRTNLDLMLTKRMSFSVNMANSYNINTLFNPGDDYYQMLPIYSPYNTDGSFRLYNTYVDGTNDDGSLKWTTHSFFNSVAEREQNDNNQHTLASNDNFSLNLDILKGLKFTSQLGIDYQSGFEDTYSARTNWSGMSLSEGAYGYSSRSNANFLLWTAIQRLNFDRNFGKHKVGGVLGFEASSKRYYAVGATGSGFVNDNIKEISYAVDYYGTSSSKTTRTMSFLGQGSYSYDNRYYLVLNARRDGNSDFGTDVQWANFGSVGLSWNVHNEPFYNLDNINILKLKCSYGTNGNSRLGSTQSLGLYSYDESDNYMGESGGSMSASPNPKLSWETTKMLNVGLRLRLFNRFDIDMEAYNNRTVNLLSDLDVSRLTGDTRVYRNVGSILNKGFEATIGAELVKKKDLEWTAELNLSHNKNSLLELYNGIQKVMGEKIWREGYDINTFYLVRWAGVDPRDGAPLWYDANGNITRVYSTANRVPYKSSSPHLTGGLSNTVTYKDFTVNALLSYVLGGYAFSNFGRRVSSDGLNIMDENQSINQLDRWQKPGDLALSPKPVWGVSTGSVMNSTRYLYNATYALLRNVSLSYALHSRWISYTGLSNVNLSLIGDNLALWTPFDHKNRNSYRQSRSGYPMETTLSVGLACNF